MACSPGIAVFSPSYQPYSQKSASLCAPQAWMTRLAFGNPIGRGGFSYTVSLSSKRIRSWFDTMSQFRQTTVQWLTIFCDARYNIFRRESSLVNDGLFFVIFRNWRFSPSITNVSVTKITSCITLMSKNKPSHAKAIAQESPAETSQKKEPQDFSAYKA